MGTVTDFYIINTRHPYYVKDSLKWGDWRECYEGGDDYVRRHLEQFSNLETSEEFEARKRLTPIQTFAASAVNDIRNSIFQRLSDVTRRDGSTSYAKAVEGYSGGVDNKGSSMQSFIGIDVLTEMLMMGRVGVYIDAPEIAGPTLAEASETRPYMYFYPVEDILSWTISKPEQPGDFQAILLRDEGTDYAQGIPIPGIKLPSGVFTRYRLLWIDPVTKKVNLRFYDESEKPIDKDGRRTDKVYQLDLTRIPFVMPTIGSSLLKNICNHQKALMNIESSNVAYCLRANYPFLTVQEDTRAIGRHLKEYVADDGTTGTTQNQTAGRNESFGTRTGRIYPMKAERPGFIHPSPEPLLASIKEQEKLEDDIRKLVNLAVQNKTGRRVESAENSGRTQTSDQGLEAGLSYIGLVLESAERQIAQHWAAYEERLPNRRKIAVIHYPDRYYLKSDADRIDESKKLSDLIYTVPGRTAKQEIAKTIVETLLSGKISVAKLEKINREIESADYTTSDPDTIIRASDAGLCGDQTASIALGFRPEEYLKAQNDHAERAERIAEAQSSGRNENMAARGVEDLDPNPNSGEDEREEASDTTLNTDKEPPVRGPGVDSEDD